MVVIEGTIEVNGKVIEVGTPSWFKFVDNPVTRSFRFDDGTDSFTCRKELVKGTDGYWYGYRKVSGKLHKRYIGKSNDLSMARLIEIGGLLNIPSEAREKLPRCLGNSEGLNELGEARETIRELQKAAIEREADFNRCIEQKVRLQEELKELHSQLGNLKRENAELKELHSQLGNSQAPLELPDPATLLNQLKAKRKKSKADLGDVEAILEMLPAGEPSKQLPIVLGNSGEDWKGKYFEAEEYARLQQKRVAELTQQLRDLEKKVGLRRR